MSDATLKAAFIPSHGVRLLGGLYLAAGPWPRPAALLLHGLPGHEKNLDLASELRQRGIHVLYLHYRGSWGSPGDFSIPNLLPDALAGMEWLAARPEADPARLAVVGFSLGGWVALALAAERPATAACVAISPLIDPARSPLPEDLAQEAAATLHGTSPARLREEWAALPSANHPARRAQAPVLLVTGDGDDLFPADHVRPLAAALPHLRWVRFPRADHAFSDVRPGMRHVVATWLSEVLEPASA